MTQMTEGHEMSDSKNYGTNPDQQDSAFYTNDSSPQVVWEDENNPRFYVIRNGEMRIHARKNLEDDHDVIRYTDRLEEFGIKTDKALAEWSDKGEDYFSWVNNSWFEVVDENDPEYYSEPYHAIDDAIGQAEALQAEYGNDKVVE